VLGLIWNLFLAIVLSIGNKKRAHYSKIVSSLPEQEKVDSKDVKSLFE
jgi:hypothetical protein